MKRLLMSLSVAALFAAVGCGGPPADPEGAPATEGTAATEGAEAQVGLAQLLDTMGEQGGSELQLEPGSPPAVVADGTRTELEMDALTADDTRRLLTQVCPAPKLEELAGKGRTAFRFTHGDAGEMEVQATTTDGAVSVIVMPVSE